MIDADVDEEEAALGQGGPDQIEERRDHEKEESARRNAAGHRGHRGGLATLGALSLLLSAFLLCELTLLNLRVLYTDTAQLDFVTEQALRSFILHQEHKSVTVISASAFTYGLNLLLPGLGQGVNTHDAHRHLRGVERPTHS